MRALAQSAALPGQPSGSRTRGTDFRDRSAIRTSLRLNTLLLATACFLYGQIQRNPYNTLESVEQGRSLFQTHCAYCHGARGDGGRGADLTLGQYRRGGSDADLFATIRNGIPGTMPAVTATDDEVWMMTAFVKRLGSPGLYETAQGKAIAGRAIYEGKGNCTDCHAIGRNGGSLGPDLSDVGRRRTLQFLEESLVNPNADVPVRYRAIAVVTKSGETVAGIRLNEDDVSIQLRDRSDNLRSFLKADIREIRHDKASLMPSYSSTLNRAELEDVVAYLNSLRGAQ
jgi:cytochrome c oxidase cbb3-type subunit 3